MRDKESIPRERPKMNRQQRRAAERASRKAATPDQHHRLLSRARQALAQDRPHEAEEYVRPLVERSSSCPQARVVLANSLRARGRLDEAMLEGRRAVTALPADPEAHEALGRILAAQDRIVEAIQAYEQAVTLAPDRVEAHNLLGGALVTVGVLDRAHVHFEKVVANRRNQVTGHVNLGLINVRMGHYAKAIEHYDRALAQTPDQSAIRWNRAFANMSIGNLAEAWDDYEYGFVAGQRKPARDLPLPAWQGEDLRGKTILVWGEQGLGDEVRFASCVDDLVARADHVVLECQPRLVPLFARSFPNVTVRPTSVELSTGREFGDLSGIDLQVPAGSLARFLRRRVADFPRRKPYLRAEERARSRLRRRLDGLEGLRVGIAWRSGNLSTNRLGHYFTLEELAPGLAAPGISLVNLQYGDVDLLEQELSNLEATQGLTVHRWNDIDYTNDLDTVASLTAELDLVVGPGTFSALLAGALGVPTRMLLAPPATWPHGQAEDPWMPAVRSLVRDWDESWDRSINIVASEVRQLAEQKAVLSGA